MMKKGKHSHSNLKNGIIGILAPLPCVIFYLSFLRYYTYNDHDGDQNTVMSWVWSWCYHHPLLLANSIFFLNINLLFWLIGHLQSSHWMIDPYWTVIPVMLGYYYATHPYLATYDHLWRSRIVMMLTWVWSIRLSHNYFRREKWEWGAREDWRFTDMRLQYGHHWWWVSFFAIYLSQQIFLMGLSLPFYIIHTVEAPWNIWDIAAITLCITGVIIAYYADTQLHEFVTKNDEFKVRGKPIVPTLETGLWRYSRHPNYFGEQLWWWGLGVFAWRLGHGWTCIGALVNTLCLAYVTILVEERMVKQPFRAKAYKCYKKTTSVWIPWFKSSSLEESKDKTN